MEFLLQLPDISEEEVMTELRAQINEVIAGGIQPDHISSHFGLLSFYPPYFDMGNQLAREFDFPVRSPVAASRKFPVVYKNESTHKLARKLTWKLGLRHPLLAMKLAKQFKIEEMERKSRELDALGIPHPGMMIDSFYGDPTPSNLLHILENLPPGTSEILVHLGNSDRQKEYPSGLDTVYLRNRECELMTITSPYLQECLTSMQIKKVSYADL